MPYQKISSVNFTFSELIARQVIPSGSVFPGTGFVSETMNYAWAYLRLVISCLSLPCVGIIGAPHHAWLPGTI